MTDTERSREADDREDDDGFDRLFPFEDGDDDSNETVATGTDGVATETNGGATDADDVEIEVGGVSTEVDGAAPVADFSRDVEADLPAFDGERTDTRDATPKQPVGNRLSTGIESLDRQLDGGIPPGRLVTLVAPPDTQSELLIKELATERNVLYLSTIRPRWELEEELRDHIQRNHDSGRADETQIEKLSAGARLEEAKGHLDRLENRSLLIVNAVNELEVEAENRYAEFLNAVKEALWDTASIGVFYQVKEDQPSPGRTITLRRTDLVWKLHKSMQNTGIDHYLEISKFRGGSALRDPIKLKLTDEVRIDTSRDIA